MASFPRCAPWWAILCMIQLALAANPTVFIPDINTTISLRFAPDSADLSFYVSSPDFFQYTAIGLGTQMSDALMFVVYAGPDNSGGTVTISPRIGSADVEPSFLPGVNITVHPNSGIKEHEMIVNATCHNCRSWPTGQLSTGDAQTVLFATGPGISLATDDLNANIRRHIGYGSFPIDFKSATGTGWVPESAVRTASQISVLDNVVKTSSSRTSVIHGVLFVVTTLAIGPFDALIAGALRKWPGLHAVSATVYVAFVIGAFVPGVLVSREHAATQNFRTPHQAIGLLTVILLFAMYLWGAGLGIIKRGAKKRGQEPPELAVLLGKIHRWVGRFIWILLVLSGGLGLALANRNNIFILGYCVLVGGVFIFLLPVWFCVWRYRKHQREKESQQQEEMELHDTIYNQNYQQGHGQYH